MQQKGHQRYLLFPSFILAIQRQHRKLGPQFHRLLVLWIEEGRLFARVTTLAVREGEETLRFCDSPPH